MTPTCADSMRSNFRSAALSYGRGRGRPVEAGAISITFVDRGDEPVLEPKPGEIRLWSDTLVRALFDESSDATQSARSRVAQTLGPHITRSARRARRRRAATGSACGSTDWKPMRFGRRLWVCPTTSALRRKIRMRSSCGSIPGSRSARARTRPPPCACRCSMPCRSPAAP